MKRDVPNQENSSRSFRIVDAASVHAREVVDIYAPFVLHGSVTFESVVPGVDEMSERILTTSKTHPYLVAIDDAARAHDANDDDAGAHDAHKNETRDPQSAVLGYAYAGAFRTRLAYQWTTEVSVYVAPNARRRGVARSLYDTLFALLSAQGFFRAVAVVTVPNEESTGFHARCGFHTDGVIERCGFKAGRWHDVAFMSRDLTSSPGASSSLPTSPPVAAATMRERTTWKSLLSTTTVSTTTVSTTK